jgi:Sec-independent protein translocase protein TatA
MPGLSMSELAIVLFILLLVSVAARLPRWGESMGSYWYRRSAQGRAEARATTAREGTSSAPPEGTSSPGKLPPPPR